MDCKSRQEVNTDFMSIIAEDPNFLRIVLKAVPIGGIAWRIEQLLKKYHMHLRIRFTAEYSPIPGYLAHIPTQ